MGTIIPIKYFYIMRHGETVANAEDYAAGTLDTPLTVYGRKQAKAAQRVCEALAPPPVLIVHSHLIRARDTALIVNETLKLPIIEDPSIGEQCFGQWQGLAWTEVRKLKASHENPPNGESTTSLISRVISAFQRILKHADGVVLIVSHGGVFDALLQHFGCKLEDVKNCDIYAFQPAAQQSPFPWEIWHTTLSEEGAIIRQSVPIYQLDYPSVPQSNQLNRRD